MQYTLNELFKIIDEPKTPKDFFSPLAMGDLGTSYYLDLITSFTPDEKQIIEADGHKKRISNQELGDYVINADILLYEFISHSEDFIINKMKDMNEVLETMLGPRGICNMFTGDMIIIRDGKRKKYRIKNRSGNIITCLDLPDNSSAEDISIEWMDE